MSSEITFIYDGECPFCNHFAELLELKSSIPSLQIIDGRKNLAKLTSLYKQGYDLNDGAILLINNTVLHGADAVNLICSQINEPNNSLLNFLRVVFKSKQRSKFLFPFLIWSRRFLLSVKGKEWRPVNKNIEYY